LNTSPHLVSLNERIRLNGHPVSDELFIKHFWAVWDGLVATRDEAEGDPIIPAHFRFLTLVAFHLFLTHRVPPLLPSTSATTAASDASDAAAHLTPIECVVLEVGLGGRLDATNVASAPVCVGFSSIGFDHQEVLGYTLREIASEKAGIIKPHCHAFSTANQSAEVREVFEAAAAREQASGLTFVPALLPDALRGATLGLAGAHQYENAGLACALAWHFLCAMAREHPSDERFADYRAAAKSGRGFDAEAAAHLPPKFLRALQRTRWPGRCQKLAHPSPVLRDRVAFYVDGAHTDASMRVACDWFRELDANERAAAAVSSPSDASPSSSSSSSSYTLLFNCGHVRDPIELMVPLVGLAHPSVDIGAAAASMPHPSCTSTAASSTSSSPASSHPIRFSRFLCAPFDHDRPHLSAAPTFEKLLRNHLLPMPRHSNAMLAKFAVMQKKERQQQYHLQQQAATAAAVAVEEQPKEALMAAATSSGTAAESVQIAPWIHPVLLRFLQARFAFPSPRLWEVERLLQQATADADAANEAASSSSDSSAALLRSQLEEEQQRLQREVAAAQSALPDNGAEASSVVATNNTFMALAEASIARVVAAFPPPQFAVPADVANASSAAVVANATPASWQLTLFRVWTMVEQAFLCADEGDAAQQHTQQGSACEYFPSVRAALQSIEAEALAAGPTARRKVLGTGSLYLVGNVLHALDWHEEEAQRAASDQ
jgi:folylpolyglutamate synthase/dihydropteroate synthase